MTFFGPEEQRRLDAARAAGRVSELTAAEKAVLEEKRKALAAFFARDI